MRTRRLTTTGLGVVAALTLAVSGSGCGVIAGAGTSSPDVQTSPITGKATAEGDVKGDAREALIAATTKLNEDTVQVAMTMAMGANGSMEATGSLDPVNKRARYEMFMGVGSELMKINMIMLEQDLYMRIAGDEMAEMSDVWLHVDTSKIPDGSAFDMMPDGDPAGAANMIEGLVDVEWTSDTTMSGTIDMTKSSTADPEMLDALGDRATAVPFTATLDDEGRLVELVVDTASLAPGMGTIEARYSNFGAPVSVEAPTDGEIMPLPDAMLGMLEA
ncbi:hypothetical protein O7632_26365 [Solwaraspora sp. WMMD406]|uniref:hypothetical protein n=1 Tax=Solwaraspora sp. WMMD406 TaxID=3016095 RepID=UPI0024164D89|nr:hypothetical protein [Solwaraspora sp. WMMD406]MDG4767589.1 hypothetical protein [Solwaraspora sp. WMMD406]